MKQTVALFTFGGWRVQRDGQPYEPFSTRKVAALLAYLAVTQREQPREALATLLWEDRPQSVALTNLRVALSDLRKHVGEFVTITRHTVAINDSPLWVDANQLSDALATTPTDPQRLQTALAHYHGDFLAGFHLRGAKAFMDWAAAERERLHQLALTGFRQLSEHYLANNDDDVGIPLMQQWLTLDPLEETAHRRLMRLLARQGRHAAALAQFERCCTLLADELGVEPATETVALADQIAAGRLERGAPTTPHNLPPDLTPFFGRNDELHSLDQLLAQPTARLISIVGTGGMGKSRLARTAGQRFVDNGRFPQGVYWVPLASMDTPSQVIMTIGDVLGLSFSAAATPEDQLFAYLKRKRICLILDNFEQIQNGAEIITRLLKATDVLVLLITSRDRLHLHAEHIVQVRGLPFARFDETETPAATLFIATARRISPDIDLDSVQLDTICHLVEGMPLALELAAGWTDTLPLQKIANAIDESLDFLSTDSADLPPRQRSIRGIFETTWQRLSAPEQALLAACAYFRGGFTHEAALAVCATTPHQLARLVRNSLLKFDKASGRYSMHELLRQFAEDKLKERTAERYSIGQRHCDYYCHWLSQQEQRIRVLTHPIQQSAAFADVKNIARAWQQAVDDYAVDNLVAAIATWGMLLMRLDRYHDGRDTFQQMVTVAEKVVQEGRNDARWRYILGVALLWRADFVHILDGDGQLEKWLKRSIALLTADDVIGISLKYELPYAYDVLGDALDRVEAADYYRQGLDAARAAGDRWSEANALSSLWQTLRLSMQNLSTATETALEAYRLRRELDDVIGLAWSAQQLALNSLSTRQYDTAADYAQEALNARRRLGSYNPGLAHALQVNGWVAMLQGEFSQAVQYAQEANTVWETLGLRYTAFDALYLLALAQIHLGAWSDAQQTADLCQTEAASTNNQTGAAYAYLLLGMLSLVQGNQGMALEHLRQAIQSFEALSEVRGSLTANIYQIIALAFLDKDAASRVMLDVENILLSDGHYPLAVARFNAAKAVIQSALGLEEEARATWLEACEEPLLANSRWFETVIEPYR